MEGGGDGGAGGGGGGGQVAVEECRWEMAVEEVGWRWRRGGGGRNKTPVFQPLFPISKVEQSHIF